MFDVGAELKLEPRLHQADMQTGKQASTEADIMTGRRARRQASIHVDPSFSCPDYNIQIHTDLQTSKQAHRQTG